MSKTIASRAPRPSPGSAAGLGGDAFSGAARGRSEGIRGAGGQGGVILSAIARGRIGSEAARTVKNLVPMGTIPKTERHARPLTTLPMKQVGLGGRGQGTGGGGWMILLAGPGAGRR